MKRLKAAMLVPLCILSAQCGDAGAWATEKGSDPMSDEPFAQSTVSSLDGRYRLTLGCSGKGSSPSPIIQSQTRLAGLGRDTFDPRMVHFRLDDGKVQDTIGYFVDDMMGFRGGDPDKRFDREILNGIVNARKLAIEFDDGNGDSHQAVFEVVGAAKAIQSVTAHCGKQ